MKRISLAFLLLIFVSGAIAQYSSSLTLQGGRFHRDRVGNTRIMFGIGTLYNTYSEKSALLAEINANIHLYKPLFLNIGIDADPTFSTRIGSYFRLGLYVCPNLGFHVWKNRFSIFLGGGIYLHKPGPYGDLLGGIGFVRTEYNINRKFSTGLELKLSRFQKGDNRELITFASGNIYIAYKF